MLSICYVKKIELESSWSAAFPAMHTCVYEVIALVAAPMVEARFLFYLRNRKGWEGPELNLLHSADPIGSSKNRSHVQATPDLPIRKLTRERDMK